MSSAKLALAAGLLGLAVSGCGIAAKPEVGSPGAAVKNHKGIDDPRKTHVACLRADHLPVLEFSRTWLQVGSKPYGPTVHFAPTPGAAQDLQITGQVEGAEVIGSALVYPNQAAGGLLQQVEHCIALGVTG